MNTQEKSLALAELMGWELSKTKKSIMNMGQYRKLCPYNSTYSGLYQFAAILLKFPRVLYEPDSYGVLWGVHVEPTQENILDAILQMEGREI